MPLPEAYLETTFVSYLTAELSNDLIVAGRQRSTREWWKNRRDKFDLFASQVVWEEASDGDEEEIRKRLDVLESIPLLEIGKEAVSLARALTDEGPLPEKAEVDAFHIAIAVVGEVDYLLTWNLKHIANATMRNKIDEVCRSRGHEPIVICTPEELMEG